MSYTARSGASVGSRGGSGRYRKVAHNSNVDETLFGGGGASKRGSLRSAGRNVATPAAPVSMASMLSASDLARIKASSVIKSPEDIAREAAAARARSDAKGQLAKARKAKMLSMEADRIAKAPKSTLEIEEEESKKTRLKKSEHQIKEELDDVKTMQRFARYAQTVAIRDKQLVEKKEREAAEKEADRIRDLEMEIDRLKQIKMFKEREETRRAKLIKDRSMIEVQIDANKKAKEDARAEIRREQEQKKREMEALAEKEKQEMIAEQARQKKHLIEVLAANDAAIALKKKRKEDEVEEDRKIVAFLKAEDAKKRAREEEEAAVKQQREMEIAKLRAQQQKMADKDAELDALRAKRAFEDGERAVRRKELEAARKAKEAQDELVREREKQRLDREWAMALEAKQQKEQYEVNVRLSAEELERTRKEEHAKLVKNHRHKDEILKMIEEREGEAKQARVEWLKRGEDGVRAVEKEVGTIKEIRDRKVKELLDAGVPERYTVQLAKFNPEDALSKDYRLGGRIPTIS